MAHRNIEKGIAAEAKTNPKKFWKYMSTEKENKTWNSKFIKVYDPEGVTRTTRKRRMFF